MPQDMQASIEKRGTSFAIVPSGSIPYTIEQPTHSNTALLNDMKTLLVTGTDTNVGKTWVTCLLLKQLRGEGVRVGAYKPVCSGAEFLESGPVWQDVENLRQALGGQHDVDQICPQRFRAAVAPNVAARMENSSVDDRMLRTGVEAWRGQCDYLIVEGAGGLLCPISDKTTVADLAVDLELQILIVASNRLGVINHSLLTVEVARQRGLSIAGVVLNDLPNRSPDDLAADESNVNQLAHWMPDIPLFTCGSGANCLQAFPSNDMLGSATKLFG